MSGLLVLGGDYRPPAKPAKKPTCLWAQEQLDSDCWGTGCGQAFAINDGTPRDNGMRFCCYCGVRIRQRKAAR